VTERDCPGHVASDDNPKVCARCGVHIDELRPADEWPNWLKETAKSVDAICNMKGNDNG
jgi:hypothetical protein